MRKENFNLFFAKRSRLLKSGEAAIFKALDLNNFIDDTEIRMFQLFQEMQAGRFRYNCD